MGASVSVLSSVPARRGAVWVGRLAVALALLLGAPISAQQIDIAFERIDSDDSPYVVLSALQDREGFMWFGTQHGLYRYDGHSFVLDEPTSTAYRPRVSVYALLEVEEKTGEEGDESYFWIGTQRGLGQWNRSTNEYTHFGPSSPSGRAAGEVRALLYDKQGSLWVGRMNGLSRLRDDGNFEHYLHDPNEPTSISDDEIRSLAEDSEGNIWVATGRGGINRLDADRSRGFEHFRHDPTDPTSLSDDQTRVAYIDGADQLWVGTVTGGLNRYDAEGRRFERFQADEDRPGSSLSSSRVRSIFEDQNGDLWIGTDDGLNLYDRQRRRFFHYRNSLTNLSSISDDRVNTIYQDESGVLWLGTQWRISKFDRKNLGAFELMWRDPDAVAPLSANTIQAFAEGDDGALWIGTYDGLNRYDPTTKEYIQFHNRPGDPTSLSNDRVGSLLVDRTGALWIGTYEGGLNRYDPAKGVFERIETPKPKVPCIFEDSSGTIWVATFDGGLTRLDPRTMQSQFYRHDARDPRSLSSDKVISIFEDRQGTLWFGTHSGGLNRFNEADQSFTRFVAEDDRPESLSSNGIFSIAEYDGDLLVGTFGGGLNVWTRADRAAGEPIFSQEDLRPRTIYGLLIDNTETRHIWASTEQGLWRRPAAGGSWKRYGGAEDFNFGAYMRSESGDLYFGSNAGALKVAPNKIEPNTYKPAIRLTNFLIRNEPRSLTQPVSQVTDFQVDYRDAVVTFEFAALDYTAPEQTRYEYRLGQKADDWVNLGNVRRATFTNLAAKHHEFWVRSRNNDGVVTDQVHLATIHVAPHPLRSKPAYTLYGLALIAAAWWFLRSQSRKRGHLEQLVNERTAALADQNRALEELNEKFEEASYTDSLTGLRNRRYLLGTIDKDLDLVVRHYTDRERSSEINGEVRPDFLFLLIDLDGFKEVNDTYGHTAGDRVLTQVCKLMENACRKSDTLIRWGGDEFLVVGRYTERRVAEDLAGRIREAICEHPFEIGIGRPIRLTCSIGFSCFPFVPTKPNLLNWEQIIGIADQALYLVKEAGRNSWAGVFSTEKSHLAPGSFFTTEIHERFEQLEHEMFIDVRRPRAKRKASTSATA